MPAVTFEILNTLYEEIPRDGAINMAIDEMLARTCTVPWLRVYRWAEPSLSFGYFGEYKSVESRWPGRRLVRRWTGGGEVPHGEDFTYTIVVPANHPFARIGVRESYRTLHAALSTLLPSTSLAQSDAAENAACFARPVVSDILHGSQKIAGAAQRRGKFGLLHQGSLQGLTWPPNLSALLARKLAHTSHPSTLPSQLFETATQLAAEKYASEEWLKRR